MNRSVRVLAVAAAALMLLGACGCNKLRARDQLNKGVQAFKNNRYETAIENFKNAVNLDPDLLNARLYLATAYASQYIPDADTPENNRFAEQAIIEYKKVLEQHPPKDQQVNTLKGIALLYLHMKKLDQAREYYQKVMQLDPNDPEPYYSIAFIDWTQSYRPRMELRAKLGLDQNASLTTDKKACQNMRDANLARVQEAMQMLNKALQLRPDYDDAMAYLNLVYREQADIECGNPAAHAADLKQADEWLDKTMETRKAKAEKAAPQGIIEEPSKAESSK